MQVQKTINKKKLIYFGYLFFSVIAISALLFFVIKNNSIQSETTNIGLPHGFSMSKESEQKLKNDFTSMYLTEAANDTDNHDLAQELLSEALKTSSKDKLWGIHYNKALKYKTHGEYKKAIAEFTTAIKLNPDCYQCYGSRGNAYTLLGNEKNALADLNKALNMTPNKEDYYARFYVFRNMLNQPDKALNDLKASIALDKAYIPPYYSMIILLVDQKNLQEAHKYLNEYKALINQKNIPEYNRYLMASTYYYSRERNMSSYFKDVNILFKNISYCIKNNLPLEDIYNLKTRYSDSITEYLRNKEFDKALNVINYAIETAKAKELTEYGEKLMYDKQLIEEYKIQNNPYYYYKRKSLQIDD